jgi:trans-2,3-dihydro-3-hydroxyanthranilate isomerase
MRHEYVLADVFTTQPFGGNPLAVFPEGQRVPWDVMPRIARELNLSETVFVLPPADPSNTCRLRILTPAMELPFAGHPTVGTACILAAAGRAPFDGDRADVVFEEGVGPVPVEIRREDNRFSARFTVPKLPVIGQEPPPSAVLAPLLALEPTGILDGADRPRGVSCGVPFLFITVRDHATLARIHLDLPVWEESIAAGWAPHIYVISHDGGTPGTTLRARMFAPAMGISEDPATGAAASALAGYLAADRNLADGTHTWHVEQGIEMGRPSLIVVEAEAAGGAITRTQVGGHCVIIGGGHMEAAEAGVRRFSVGVAPVHARQPGPCLLDRSAAVRTRASIAGPGRRSSMQSSNAAQQLQENRHETDDESGRMGRMRISRAPYPGSRPGTGTHHDHAVRRFLRASGRNGGRRSCIGTLVSPTRSGRRGGRPRRHC